MAVSSNPNRSANIAKTSGAVSVPTSAGGIQIVAENKSRAEITIFNDGANVVYLTLATAESGASAANPTPVTASGIRLNANGGSWTTNAYTGPVYGIAVTGATNVTVVEI